MSLEKMKVLLAQAVTLAESALFEAEDAVREARAKGCPEAILIEPLAKIEILRTKLIEMREKQNADNKHETRNAAGKAP